MMNTSARLAANVDPTDFCEHPSRPGQRERQQEDQQQRVPAGSTARTSSACGSSALPGAEVHRRPVTLEPPAVEQWMMIGMLISAAPVMRTRVDEAEGRGAE